MVSTATEVGRKILAGRMGLVALHSAHFSTPFVEAMNERTRRDVERQFPADGAEKVEITYAPPQQRYTVPKADARVTPYLVLRKFPEGVTKVTVQQPFCCFPAYRADGKPSTIKVLKPDHPIVKEVPKEFTLPHTGDVRRAPLPADCSLRATRRLMISWRFMGRFLSGWMKADCREAGPLDFLPLVSVNPR
jgi:hypothetical protein